MTREDAIREIMFAKRNVIADSFIDKAYDMAIEALKEQKTGKWDFMGFQMFQCSNCKHTFEQDYLKAWRAYTYEPIFPLFCSNCGCKMEVEKCGM